MAVPIFSRKGAFGSLFSAYLELFIGQFLLPFAFRFLNFFCHNRSPFLIFPQRIVVSPLVKGIAFFFDSNFIKLFEDGFYNSVRIKLYPVYIFKFCMCALDFMITIITTWVKTFKNKRLCYFKRVSIGFYKFRGFSIRVLHSAWFRGRELTQ